MDASHERLLAVITHRRLLALLFALCFHALVVWIIVLAPTQRLSSAAAAREIDVTLVSDRANTLPRVEAPPALATITPSLPPAIEPAIEIDSASETINGSESGPNRLTAPQPDPGHPNQQPTLPQNLHGSLLSAELQLRILVLEDGSVAEIVIEKGTGDRRADAMATDYVRHHWHFIPGTADGKPIQNWVTVLIRTPGDDSGSG